MINISYASEMSCYMVMLDNVKISDGLPFPIKFDTGASCTVIGVYRLYERISMRMIRELEESFMLAGIEPKEFSSATGNKFFGYPCRLHDVKIGEHTIKDFYFYLVLESRRQVSLLGNDFISCCKFSHNIGDDIVIEDYDIDLYNKNFNSIKYFDIDEVTSEVQDKFKFIEKDEDTADIAAAFKDIVDNR